jgi:hypothetical protein
MSEQISTTPWPELPPVDPYAELKAAHAAGKVIEFNPGDLLGWRVQTTDFSAPPGCYRIKPWSLPAPPPSKSWHRADGWTEEMLPSGYRPLLADESMSDEDEYGDDYRVGTVGPTKWKNFKGLRASSNHMRTTRPLPTEPEFIDLGPEDVPPSSVFRLVYRSLNSDSWTFAVANGAGGIVIGDTFIDFRELGKLYQINRSIPLTGKWNPDAWEPCHKPKP